MIRCHYTPETIEKAAKEGRNRAIGCGGLLWGLPAWALFEMTRHEPSLWFRFPDALFLWIWAGGWYGLSYFFHWAFLNIEKTTLRHAGDEITLDDNEIRLVKADGTQVTLPRDGLTCHSPFPYAAGNQIFKIRNLQIISSPEIELTSDMENAKELVETIQPGAWYTMD